MTAFAPLRLSAPSRSEAVVVDTPVVLAPMAGVTNAAFRRVWDRPDTVRRLAGIGFEAKTSTPEAFGAFIRDEIARWGRMAQAAGIQPE